MKELKRTVTTETIVGYEAFDGSTFSSREECEKYEQSARCVIRKMAYDLRVKDGNCDSLFGGFNYEDGIALWDIKDAEHLRIVNQYLCNINPCCKTDALIPADYIGYKVAVVYNEEYDYATFLGTYNEILMDFTNKLNKLFADPAPASNT